MQRAERPPVRERLLGAARRREGVVRGDVEVGVHPRIDALDALEIGGDGIARRHLPGADPARQRRRGFVAEVVFVHGISEAEVAAEAVEDAK